MSAARSDRAAVLGPPVPGVLRDRVRVRVRVRGPPVPGVLRDRVRVRGDGFPQADP